MKVQSIANNQLIITDDKGNSFFQSYDSVIAKKTKDGNIFLDSKFWNYSKTTAKYRNQFLDETTKETRQKIENGIYKLTNLN